MYMYMLKLYLRRLTNKIKFSVMLNYILLPHPPFSMIINSDAMKQLKMDQTVANTHL